MQLPTTVHPGPHVAKLSGILEQVDGDELLHPAHQGSKAVRRVCCERCSEDQYLRLLVWQCIRNAQQHTAHRQKDLQCILADILRCII